MDCYKTSDIMQNLPRKYNAPSNSGKTQKERAKALFSERGMLRLKELEAAGIAATTISRMVKDGDILRISRGLYQLHDASIDIHHDLAEAAKRIPKGVICLTSALAYYDLTDTIAPAVYIAIGHKDWHPVDGDGLRLKIVRMSTDLLASDVETHRIEGVEVAMFSIARTLADAFRLRKTVGLNIAIEALTEAVKTNRVQVSQVANCAKRVGSWRIMRPYLETLTING